MLSSQCLLAWRKNGTHTEGGMYECKLFQTASWYYVLKFLKTFRPITVYMKETDMKKIPYYEQQRCVPCAMGTEKQKSQEINCLREAKIISQERAFSQDFEEVINIHLLHRNISEVSHTPPESCIPMKNHSWNQYCHEKYQ